MHEAAITRRHPAKILVLSLLTAFLPACSTIEEGTPRPTSTSATIPLNVPPIMRNTVAAEAVMLGFDDVVARGYGLVVGLNGTGDTTQPDPVRAHMSMEMQRMGVGSERHDLNISPERMLSSPDTAVVLVEAVIPPGAPKGSIFDVRVSTLPGSDATSLEGGRLYTTQLRPALRPGLPPTGSRQAAPIAVARGRIFTNPFAEPGEVVNSVINRRVGRILGGGATIRPMPLKLRLATPSHNGAMRLEQAINHHFPQEPGQRYPTAHAQSDEMIEITVPPSYRDRTREFVNLVQHTTTNLTGVERWIQVVNRLAVENPADCEHASWRWQAFGTRALPAIKELYAHPDERPRLAALRAGARLDDPLVIPHLLEVARLGSPAARVDAIELLADMRAQPRIDAALRELADDDNVTVRLAAYEALVERRNRFFVDREVVDDKFLIDVVASDKPLVYVTQQDEPRIVIFGPDLSIDLPVTVSAWSNRFMMRGDPGETKVDVRYQDLRTGDEGVYEVDLAVPEFLRFLGHQTTIESPTPGLGLTYSETVGLLHRILQEGYIDAPFVAEQDRLLAQIIDRERSMSAEERPEFSDPDFDFLREREGVEPPRSTGEAGLEDVLGTGTMGGLRPAPR